MRPIYRQVSAITLWMAVILAGCRSHATPACAVAEPVSVQPAPPQVASTEAPTASTNVPARELAGLVLDANTGEPLPFAQVTILVRRRLRQPPAMSDSGGRFSLSLPNGAVSVQARRLGYAMESVAMDPHPDSGYTAVFALRPEPIVVCNVVTAR